MANGFFLGGIAKGLQAQSQIDQNDRALSIKEKLAQAEGDKARQAQLKDLLDRTTTNFKDIIASGKVIKQNAADPAQAQRALSILRDRIATTGAMLAQIPGGTAAAQSALDQFDADVLGTPTAVEAGKVKGQATAAEVTAAAPAQTAAEVAKQTALGPVNTQNAVAQATALGPVQAQNAAATAAASKGAELATTANFAGVSGTASGTQLVAKLKAALGRDPTQQEIAQSLFPSENITIDPKTGQISITKGGLGQSAGTRGAQTLSQEAAKKLPELTDQLVALKGVQNLIKPEFLTFAGQADASLTALMERASLDRSPEAKQRLADLTTFQAKAQSQLNQAIKSLSGAAVTAPEEARLLRDFPDPRSDSYTQFVAKFNAKLETIKMAVARYSYAARNGLDWQGIALDNMPNIMRDRAADIRRQNPNITAPDLQKQLGTEFNLIGF